MRGRQPAPSIWSTNSDVGASPTLVRSAHVGRPHPEFLDEVEHALLRAMTMIALDVLSSRCPRPSRTASSVASAMFAVVTEYPRGHGGVLDGLHRHGGAVWDRCAVSTPMVRFRLVTRALAARFGRYCSCSIAATTLSRVSARIASELLSTRDGLVRDTGDPCDVADAGRPGLLFPGGRHRYSFPARGRGTSMCTFTSEPDHYARLRTSRHLGAVRRAPGRVLRERRRAVPPCRAVAPPCRDGQRRTSRRRSRSTPPASAAIAPTPAAPGPTAAPVKAREPVRSGVPGPPGAAGAAAPPPAEPSGPSAGGERRSRRGRRRGGRTATATAADTGRAVPSDPSGVARTVTVAVDGVLVSGTVTTT